MVLHQKLWNFDLRRRKTWQITKNYETLIYNGKSYGIYQNIEVFKQIYSFRTLIYNGKTMALQEKNYDTIPNTIELGFMGKKPYSLIQYISVRDRSTIVLYQGKQSLSKAKNVIFFLQNLINQLSLNLIRYDYLILSRYNKVPNCRCTRYRQYCMQIFASPPTNFYDLQLKNIKRLGPHVMSKTKAICSKTNQKSQCF